MPIDVVVNFIHRDEMILAKTMGRRVCPDCGKGFNIAYFRTDDGYDLPPILPKGTDPTICDVEECATRGTKLVTRADDNEEVVKQRIAVYMKETLPILKFYRENTDTIVIDFEAKKGISDFPKVQDLIEKSLQKI